MKEIRELHQKALEASNQYKKAERTLIDILQRMDELKGFRDLGYKTLHEYVVQALELSDAVAYTLITLARKSKEVPLLREKLENQEIGISQARMIAPILTVKNQDLWLEKAENLSKRELEKEIKKAFPERAVLEQTRYVAESRMELKVGMSEELHEAIQRVQDLVSQKKAKAASLEETIQELAKFYLEKNDPLKKAERKLAPGPKNSKVPSSQNIGIGDGAGESRTRPGASRVAEGQPGRASVPAALKHAINKRDQGQCTFVSKGKRCQERRRIDIHHVVPVNLGGDNSLENLTTICRGHHQLVHETLG